MLLPCWWWSFLIVIRPHHSAAQIWPSPIATDEVLWPVCLSVGWSVCHDHEHAKMTEPIKISFEMWTRVGPRKHVLDGSADWCNLANMTEPSMCGGDASLCQLTLTTY